MRNVEDVIYTEDWHVGMIRQPIHSLLTPGVRRPIEWLPFRRPNRYLADPFEIEVGRTRKPLKEEADSSTPHGIIVEAELTDGHAWSPPRPVFDTERHMAYPYLFENRGEVCCPPDQHLSSLVLYTFD